MSNRAEPSSLQQSAENEEAQPDLAPRVRPVQQRAKDTVEQILAVAAVLLAEKGFDGFNTNVLAERAGVAVRSVYRYFPNKLAVIVALVERQQLAWEEPIEHSLRLLADPSQDVFQAYCGVIEGWVEHFRDVRGSREIRRAMVNVPELRALDLADGDVIARRIAEALRERGIETPLDDLKIIVRMCVTAFDAIFDDALFRHDEVPQSVLDEIELMITNYLRSHLE